MGITGRLRKLEREARGEFIEIPQCDVAVARFSSASTLRTVAPLLVALW